MDYCLNKNLPGYKGKCCCNCEYQFEIAVCSCPVCSKVEGYICIMYHISDHSYKCKHKKNKHGLCEMWRKKNE
jgi:hypothetical protein